MNLNVTGMRIGHPSRTSAKDLRSVLHHFWAVCDLADTFEYNLQQRNGQRIFGPPKNWGNRPEPDKDCEIYIGHIPKGIFEDTLVPYLSMFGNIYSFRCMLDFSGNNRGFAFATFTTPEEAAKALILDNFEIKKGKFLTVMKSQDNDSISLWDVPFSWDTEQKIRMATEGVKHVCLIKSAKGYCKVIVTYDSHRHAALGRRALMQQAADLFLSHRIILVDWSTRLAQREAPNQSLPGPSGVQNSYRRYSTGSSSISSFN